jgi:hypothetical protein
MDSAYARTNIKNMSVTDVSDTLRVLKIFLKEPQQYLQYEISYNPRTYLLRTAKYYLHDGPVDPANGNSGTGVVTIRYSNYSTAVIDEENFRESRFVYKDGTTFYAQSPYGNYRIIGDGQ